MNIAGYKIYRQDRSANGGGVAIYVQSQIPVRVMEDLRSIGVEIIWLQVQMPYPKPVFIGCCSRPTNATIMYLDQNVR